MSFNLNKLTQENAKAMVIIVVVIVVLIFVVVWANKFMGGIGSVLSSLNPFADDPATEQKKQDIENAAIAAATPTSPWSPSFYQSAPEGSKLLTTAYADQLVDQIWDSIPWFYFPPPDAGPTEAAIKQCSTQSQVSFLADRFNTRKGTDLYTWITRTFAANLDSPGTYTVDVINKYVANLPKYN